jgi:hypothetical protein
MTNYRHLVDQHIRHHESHLAHIDELIARTNNAPIPAEVHGELAELKAKRDAFAGEIKALKRKPLVSWQKEEIPLAGLGPMVIWGIVAKQLEKLVERLGV